MNNQPSVNSTYTGSKSFSHGLDGTGGCPNASETIDVTGMMNAVLNNTINFDGIELRGSETDQSAYKGLCSQNYNTGDSICYSGREPILTLTYTSNTTVPGAPTNVSATASSQQASVSWTPPSNNGGATITGYTVKAYRASDNSLISSTSASSSPKTVTGLTNGTGYYFTVAATNSQGTGAESAHSTTVTPTGGGISTCYSSDHCWGVDSSDSVSTAEATAQNAWSTPDFIGRYITGSYAMSQSEATYAQNNHIPLLLISEGYDDETTESEGESDAAANVQAATSLGVPENNGIAIFLDDEGENTTSSFIQGWYEGIEGTGFIPGFYGDDNGNYFGGSSGPYCTAVQANSNIGQNSVIWTWEPDTGQSDESHSPNFSGAATPGCAATVVGWQYGQPASQSDPNDDTDEWIPNKTSEFWQQ